MFEMDDGLLVALLITVLGFTFLLFSSSCLQDEVDMQNELIQRGVDNGHLIYHPQTSELTFTTCEAEE